MLVLAFAVTARRDLWLQCVALLALGVIMSMKEAECWLGPQDQVAGGLV